MCDTRADSIIAHCTRRGYNNFQKILRTQSGILYTAGFLGCAAMVGTVYSLNGLSTTLAIPLMLVVLQLVGSLSLVMPQVSTHMQTAAVRYKCFLREQSVPLYTAAHLSVIAVRALESR